MGFLIFSWLIKKFKTCSGLIQDCTDHDESNFDIWNVKWWYNNDKNKPQPTCMHILWGVLYIGACESMNKSHCKGAALYFMGNAHFMGCVACWSIRTPGKVTDRGAALYFIGNVHFILCIVCWSMRTPGLVTYRTALYFMGNVYFMGECNGDIDDLHILYNVIAFAPLVEIRFTCRSMWINAFVNTVYIRNCLEQK